MALSAVLGAAALAGQAPAPHPSNDPSVAPPGVTAPAAAAPGSDAPDDDFIEFLGADDVGDADWWEFFKKSGHSRDPPRAPPPQDPKQW